MGAIASQITSLTIVYSTVYPDENQGKHQSSASLAFVRGIHRWPVNSPHKGPVMRKMLSFDDVIMNAYWQEQVSMMTWWQTSVRALVCIHYRCVAKQNSRASLCRSPDIKSLKQIMVAAARQKSSPENEIVLIRLYVLQEYLYLLFASKPILSIWYIYIHYTGAHERIKYRQKGPYGGCRYPDINRAPDYLITTLIIQV